MRGVQVLHLADHALQEAAVREDGLLHVGVEPAAGGRGAQVLVVLLADLPEARLVQRLVVLDEHQAQVELAVGRLQLALRLVLLGRRQVHRRRHRGPLAPVAGLRVHRVLAGGEARGPGEGQQLELEVGVLPLRLHELLQEEVVDPRELQLHLDEEPLLEGLVVALDLVLGGKDTRGRILQGPPDHMLEILSGKG